MTPEQRDGIGDTIATMTAWSEGDTDSRFRSEIMRSLLEEMPEDPETRLTELHFGMSNVCAGRLAKIEHDTGNSAARRCARSAHA